MKNFKSLFFMLALCATVSFVSAEHNAEKSNLVDKLIHLKVSVQNVYDRLLRQGCAQKDLAYARDALNQVKKVEVVTQEKQVSYDLSDTKTAGEIIVKLENSLHELNKLLEWQRKKNVLLAGTAFMSLYIPACLGLRCYFPEKVTGKLITDQFFQFMNAMAASMTGIYIIS